MAPTRRARHDQDGLDALDAWPLERQGRLLSIVPSTFLEHGEAS